MLCRSSRSWMFTVGKLTMEQSFFGSLAAPAFAVGLAYVLRKAGAFSAVDGQTASKYTSWLTFPSLVLQSLHRVSDPTLLLLAAGSACSVGATVAVTSWIWGRHKHPKERGLLSGSTVGAGLALTALPVVQAFFGQEGLQLALVWGFINSIAVWIVSFLLFATAGAAFPEKYEHTDGGKYRGEWKGMLKEGFGVYTYPSGARYEGEWVENVKEGRGVYHFPRGGVYEGEWRGGKQEGVGVRTFASGKTQSGVWQQGRLQAPLQERQCALAVEGANEAAAAARRVRVGGGTPHQALGQLLQDPSTWAFAAAAALAVLQRPLTPTLDLVTQQLAQAHAPLALLAFGLTLDLQPPQPKQMREVSSVLAIRLLPPLLMAAAAAGVLRGHLLWPVAKVVGVVGPLLLCGVAPIAPQVQGYAHLFRLNENLAAALTRATNLVSLLLMPLLGSAALLAAWAGTLRPLLLALGGTMLALASLMLATSQQQAGGRRGGGAGQGHGQGRTKMVYAGPAAPQGRQQQEGSGTAGGGGEKASGADTGDGSEGSPSHGSEVRGAAGGGEVVEAGLDATQQREQQQSAPQRRRSAFQDVEAPAAAPISAGEEGAGGSGEGHGGDGGGEGGGDGGSAGRDVRAEARAVRAARVLHAPRRAGGCGGPCMPQLVWRRSGGGVRLRVPPLRSAPHSGAARMSGR